MQAIDLSYKVAVPSEPDNAIGFWQQAEIFHASPNKNELKLQYTSLIAQLVPDERPSPNPAWFVSAAIGDEQQAQICRIVDSETGDSAPAEGLFFQLIVRLHKYSLGRLDYSQSVHWRRGVVLEDDYGAHALLENVGNDVRITVRSPYPERFLSALTYEIKWLVDNFWAGLRCDVMVPCVEPCGRRAPGTGLFEVNKLINGKGRGHSNYPCSVCNEWQNVELLLRNAPAARPNPLEGLLNNSKEILLALNDVRRRLSGQTLEYMGRFDKLDANHRELVTKVDAAYANLMTALVDEAKDGPRLFSFEPIGHTLFERPNWVAGKFRLTLWCEHSRLPLTALNPVGDTHGVYELSIPREWFVRIAPYLKLLSGLLSLVVPVAASATKLVLDEASYKRIEKQLELGEKSVDSILKGSEEAGSWLGRDDGLSSGFGASVRAQGADLRRLHTWLNEKDPGYGGLLRVQNRRREFLWVHPMFVSEY